MSKMDLLFLLQDPGKNYILKNNRNVSEINFIEYYHPYKEEENINPGE